MQQPALPPPSYTDCVKQAVPFRRSACRTADSTMLTFVQGKQVADSNSCQLNGFAQRQPPPQVTALNTYSSVAVPRLIGQCSRRRCSWLVEQDIPRRRRPAAMSVNDGDYDDSDDSRSESNPLYGHPHYASVKTLSRGPAGSLQVSARPAHIRAHAENLPPGCTRE